MHASFKISHSKTSIVPELDGSSSKHFKPSGGPSPFFCKDDELSEALGHKGLKFI